MSELGRLRDEAESPLELMLLEAGSSYKCSPEARAKTLAALGVAGSAAVSAGIVSSSFASKLGWGKLLLISGLGAGIVAPLGVVGWNRFHSHATPIAKVAAPAIAVAPPAPAAEPPPVVATAEGPAEATAPAAKPEVSEVRVAPPSDLAAEVGVLDAARSRLDGGDARGALAKLDEYSHAYPHGHLVLEAEVLRIGALAKAGRKGAAQKHAAAFLRHHPNSVLASRVRGYLE